MLVHIRSNLNKCNTPYIAFTLWLPHQVPQFKLTDATFVNRGTNSTAQHMWFDYQCLKLSIVSFSISLMYNNPISISSNF